MTADYNLRLFMTGMPNELKEMLDVVATYMGNGPQYFEIQTVNGKNVDLKYFDDDVIPDLSSLGTVEITASGPFGGYGRLDEVGIFRELSEVAGDAYFNAEIFGSATYEVQNLKCEYKDGLLNISTYFADNESLDEACCEAWTDGFVEKLPCAEFIRLFKITGNDFDSSTYRELVGRMDFYSEWIPFDEFVSLLESYDAETKLDEDEFVRVIDEELGALEIRLSVDYMDDYFDQITEKYVYNPTTKS